MEMRKGLAEFLFTKLACSYRSTMEILGIDVDDKKQKRLAENNAGFSEIFTPHPLSYTTSGNSDNKGGRPLNDNVNDKQIIDKEINKLKG